MVLLSLLPTSLPLLLLLLVLLPLNQATTFLINNNCSHPIWPGSIPYGGGLHLPPSQNWTFTTNTTSSTFGTIWARTNCTFDSSGTGTCLSGDCSGALNCTSNPSSPATVIEYSLYQWGNNDFYGITLVNGFNLPVAVNPTGPANCSAVTCTDNLTPECPSELKSAGGCKSACDVFKTDEYCCNKVGSCSPTKYSRFFKSLCPNACSYPMDDPTSTFTCTSGGDFTVTFCP
ncbi:protein P21-like [Dendrobium catenatum]|uniref:Protein P21 n=1 Tax=Dendrobium catenatum TaxID=906689 RepID=A0A2I0WQC1_9ASPA|nr:protein P21-like [Dendrobium catenatum]PKU77859.1 Protein P21 [Dendrobium catenatum]